MRKDLRKDLRKFSLPGRISYFTKVYNLEMSVSVGRFQEDFLGGSDSKASVYNVGDLRSIPGSGRFPGQGNGNPLQYPCLENPMDGGVWCPWGQKELDTTERIHFHFIGYLAGPC